MTHPCLPTRAPARLPDFVAAMAPQGDGKLAVFDADGTLWCDDVADDFCAWMIAEGHVATGDRWPEYLRIYRGDHAAGCEYMLTFYAGLPLARFHELNRLWWSQAKRRWVPEALEAVHWLAEHGYTNWIVTGSPTDTMLPVLDFLPFSRVLGMDFEVDGDGVITGRLAGIATTDGGKARAVEHYGEGRPVALGAGNGTLDEAMMALAEVPWAIYPSPPFEAHCRALGWHVLPRPADFVEEAKLA